ncbi:hypothetical protein E8L99_05085 [Phreatobacter aquaticus]|uniref:Alkaline proteinase inhibitor/ Outer membrane lipoprotein Omp19 domain-containing protein n=1 Tax=Phreatobacter aquaticus TaxID=2570229 RepID=A0A4D7QDB2_9HYPH|nr:AprI/Inh family metalloprotease inhibitor [Phreatobacter aquaticus]QCK85198.1 hypothetical protein E8L99_05085 [Phreatobacter aquaticus]
MALPIVLAALAFASFIPAIAHAQPTPTLPSAAQVQRAAGPWELSNPAGDRKCELTFKPDRAAAGLALTFGPTCAQIFPVVNGVVAWTIGPNGGIRWLDRAGGPALDFDETEVGIFEALKPGDPNVYFLTNLGLAGTALPTADEITGQWSLGQPRGRALCNLTFQPELAAGAGPLEQRFALEIGAGCERSIAALALASWRLERELLVIQGGGATTLTFKREPDGRWVKTPADNRPLVMSRP